MTTEVVTPTSLNSDANLQSETSSYPIPEGKRAKQLVDWVQTNFKRSKQDRWRNERQWFLNIAFLGGKQYVQFIKGSNASQFKLVTPPAPHYRARPIINKIRPLIRTEVAKLTSQKPSAYVIPASSEDRDLYAANAGEQIWESMYETRKINRVLRRAVWWASVTGNGFMKCYWDPDAVDKTSDQMGDMTYEPITPFHIFIDDIMEVELEKQRFVMHASNRAKESIKRITGENPSNTSAATSELLDDTYRSAMNVSQQTEKKQDTVLVIEAWIKPNQFDIMPNGGLVTIAGDEIIQYIEGWPYEHGLYPFVHIQHIETGMFYAESTITDLIPLQREYNNTRGQIIESKRKMASPQLAAEEGSLDPRKITDQPGQVIMYKPGFQSPQPIPLQSLPSYVLEEQDRIKMDMDEVSGQHEVSRGQVPSGVTAATAISYLQEQDDTKLSATYDSIEEGMEKTAHMTLCYVKQYWTTERIIKVTGVDQSFDVLAFQGSDLGDNTDIRMEGGSSLPTSRAAKQAFILDLMKMGFIDPNKGLEVMEMGGISKIYEQVQVDLRQAQRENLRMAQINEDIMIQHEQAQMQKLEADPEFQQKVQAGLIMQGPSGEMIDISGVEMGMPPTPIVPPLPVPVNTWDDHRLHVEEHNKYRKSQAYEALPQIAKDLFEAHVNEHIQAIMVGAQGAANIPLEALEMANNPETLKEMDYREQVEGPDAAASAPSEEVPMDMGMGEM